MHSTPHSPVRRIAAVVAAAALVGLGSAAPSVAAKPDHGTDTANDAIDTHQPYGVGSGRKIG